VAIILSNLNRFTNYFSLANLQRIPSFRTIMICSPTGRRLSAVCYCYLYSALVQNCLTEEIKAEDHTVPAPSKLSNRISTQDAANCAERYVADLSNPRHLPPTKASHYWSQVIHSNCTKNVATAVSVHHTSVFVLLTCGIVFQLIVLTFLFCCLQTDN